MGHLTLREAVASHRLAAFVGEQQADGAELVTGSELERGLALLVTQLRLRGVGMNGERLFSGGNPLHLLARSEQHRI